MKTSSPKFSACFWGCSCFFLLLSLLCVSANAAEQNQTENRGAKKPLVAYFSLSGKTQELAKEIHRQAGGDIIRIAIDNPQSAGTSASEIAKNHINNPEQYSVIFLGFPNWWSTVPAPVRVFVEENRLDGKTIAPFDTLGGGKMDHNLDDLKKLVPHSKILPPLAVSGTLIENAEEDVKKWLEGLGTALIETTTGNPAIYPDGAY